MEEADTTCVCVTSSCSEMQGQICVHGGTSEGKCSHNLVLLCCTVSARVSGRHEPRCDGRASVCLLGCRARTRLSTRKQWNLALCMKLQQPIENRDRCEQSQRQMFRFVYAYVFFAPNMSSIMLKLLWDSRPTVVNCLTLPAWPKPLSLKEMLLILFYITVSLCGDMRTSLVFDVF